MFDDDNNNIPSSDQSTPSINWAVVAQMCCVWESNSSLKLQHYWLGFWVGSGTLQIT